MLKNVSEPELLLIAITIFLGLFVIAFIIVCFAAKRYMSFAFRKMHNFAEEVTNREPDIDSNERLAYSENFLRFIDELVAIEILNEKRFDVMLGQQNKNLNVDEVIKKVSTIVFEAIKKDVYNDKNNILTDKYLCTYIQKRVFLTYIKFLNDNVASQL